MDQNRLEINNLTFGWEKDTLFEKVSVSMKPGDRIMLQGENGSGKTTFLKLVSGMIPHFYRGKILRGDILLDGQSIIQEPPKVFYPRIAFMPSGKVDFFLLNDNLEEEVALIRAYQHLSDGEINERRQNLIRHFPDIDRLWKQSFKSMSVYEKNLSLLSVCFLQAAELFLLDEVLKTIPEYALPQWLDFFMFLSNQGKMLLCTSHDLRFETFTRLTIDHQKRIVL